MLPNVCLVLQDNINSMQASPIAVFVRRGLIRVSQDSRVVYRVVGGITIHAVGLLLETPVVNVRRVIIVPRNPKFRFSVLPAISAQTSDFKKRSPVLQAHTVHGLE